MLDFCIHGSLPFGIWNGPSLLIMGLVSRASLQDVLLFPSPKNCSPNSVRNISKQYHRIRKTVLEKD